MANGLDNLIGPIYKGLDIVSRELVGFVPSVQIDADVSRVAIGQKVISHVAPESTPVDLAPGVTAPNDGDQVIGNFELTMSYAKGVPIRWNGEQSVALQNAGARREQIMADQFAQAVRAMVNLMEGNMAVEAAVAASRAYGTPGTNAFSGSSITQGPAFVRKILDDNGAPESERKLIIDTLSAANFRSNVQVTNAEKSGTDSILKQGELINLSGLSLRQSAKSVNFVKGTATGMATATAHAERTTEITLSAGSGTVKRGDIVTFEGDTNMYVVAVGGTAANGNKITLAKPGLLQARPASSKTVTIVDGGPRSVAFTPNALILGVRNVALPPEGDMADDQMFIQDERSGLTFEIRMYKQYRQVRYELSAAWGTGYTKEEHIALLLN